MCLLPINVARKYDRMTTIHKWDHREKNVANHCVDKENIPHNGKLITGSDQIFKTCRACLLFMWNSAYHKRAVHVDVISWKHFQHYWHLLMGIHWSPVDSHIKGPVLQNFDVIIVVSLNRMINSQIYSAVQLLCCQFFPKYCQYTIPHSCLQMFGIGCLLWVQSIALLYVTYMF